MNNLKEKSKEQLSSSWLSHPVTGYTAAPSSSIGGRQDPKPFWFADGFLCSDTEPLPSMFSSKMKASGPKQRLANSGLVASASPAARPFKWHISSNRLASCIIGSFLLVFAVVDGVLLTASSFSADRRASIGLASAALDQDGTETAMVFSPPSSEPAEESQAPSPALPQGALPQGEPWPAAVDTLQQLLAKQKASQAATTKHAENERLLERLEAWMKGKTQKPAAMAAVCAGPASQCWNDATLTQ